jgi:hypothetical protein
VLGNQTYSGVPYGEVVGNSIAGAGLLTVAMILLAFLYPGTGSNNLVLVFGLVFLVAAIYPFYQASDKLKTRTLEFDASAVRWKKGRKMLWEIPWVQIRKIGTALEVLKAGTRPHEVTYTYHIFYIETNNGIVHRINIEKDFGRVEKLKEAFRVLCWRCMDKGIRLEDGLGWASDLARKFTTDG